MYMYVYLVWMASLPPSLLGVIRKVLDDGQWETSWAGTTSSQVAASTSSSSLTSSSPTASSSEGNVARSGGEVMDPHTTDSPTSKRRRVGERAHMTALTDTPSDGGVSPTTGAKV